MTNDTEYELSDEPPRDDQDHPIHPERGHRICGARKSDRSTPAPHGRSRDDYEYCLQSAGWGTDRDIGPCRNHPFSGEQWGESNPNYKNGAYAKHFKHDLTASEQEAYEDVLEKLDGDPEDALSIPMQLAAEAIMKYKRGGDQRLLREARQILAEFNLVPNAEEIQIEGNGIVINTTAQDDGDD